jgi:hypothetical protein
MYIFLLHRAHLFFVMWSISDKLVEEIETHILWTIICPPPRPPPGPEIRAVYEIMWGGGYVEIYILEQVRPQLIIKYGACALHAGYLRQQTRTQNMQYLFPFNCNNGWKNALNCDIIRAFHVFYWVKLESFKKKGKLLSTFTHPSHVLIREYRNVFSI